MNVIAPPKVGKSWLASDMALAKDHVSYVGNPKLMNGVVADITITIPVDGTEQSKIAEILSTVDRAIEQTEALIAKQQQIKTGLMQDLLTRGIDEQGRRSDFCECGFRSCNLGLDGFRIGRHHRQPDFGSERRRRFQVRLFDDPTFISRISRQRNQFGARPLELTSRHGDDWGTV